jgi:hypothetical protein
MEAVSKAVIANAMKQSHNWFINEIALVILPSQ